MSLSNTFSGVVNILTARYGGTQDARERALRELRMRNAVANRSRQMRKEFQNAKPMLLSNAMRTAANGWQPEASE